MDLGRAHVALRERPLIDVLDLSLRFCVAHAGPYAKMSLLTIAPAFGVSWAVARSFGWLPGWLVALALASLLDGPFVALASRLVFGEARVRDVVRTAAAVTPRLAVARLVQGLAFLLSSGLVGVPWLWFGSVLLFVPEVIVLERASLAGAWGRAHAIANARLGAATAAMLLLSSLVVVSVVLTDLAGRELQGLLELRSAPSIFREGGSTLALVGFWWVLPIRVTTRFFIYLDIRTRAEGWDIQTRFAALATRGARA